MTTLLCFGDLQLGVHGRLDDQAAVLERIAQTAIDYDVGLVLNAGDTFEGPGVSPECLDVFARFVARLRDNNIPVLTTLGNGRHDAAVRGVNGLAIFVHVPGVTIAPLPDVYRYDGVVVGTLPWVHPGKLIAHKGGGNRVEINAEISTLLLDIAARLAVDCREVDPDAAHVLLGHWHVDQATSANGGTTALFGEPLLPLYELEALGFDAVVLGHNHRGQLLTSEPPIFHVGSPMPHDHGEAGFDHGVWILDAIKAASTVRFVPVASRPLVTIEEHLSAHDAHGLELAVIDNDVVDAIVRVRLHGTREECASVDIATLRRDLALGGAAKVEIQMFPERVDRARVEGVDASMSEFAALDEWIRVKEYEPEFAERMRAQMREFAEQVPA